MFAVGVARRAGRALLTPRTAPLLPVLASRSVGEPTGLRPGPSSPSALHRHDSLGLVAGIGTTVVDSYARWGFVVNGVALHGAVMLLPNASLLFEPKSVAEVTPESLAVLELLENPTRMLVLGCGRQGGRVPPAVRAWCEERGVGFEALPTQHACATFNFMVSEGRPVAAVLFPLAVQ